MIPKHVTLQIKTFLCISTVKIRPDPRVAAHVPVQREAAAASAARVNHAARVPAGWTTAAEEQNPEARGGEAAPEKDVCARQPGKRNIKEAGRRGEAQEEEVHDDA